MLLEPKLLASYPNFSITSVDVFGQGHRVERTCCDLNHYFTFHSLHKLQLLQVPIVILSQLPLHVHPTAEQTPILNQNQGVSTSTLDVDYLIIALDIKHHFLGYQDNIFELSSSTVSMLGFTPSIKLVFLCQSNDMVETTRYPCNAFIIKSHDLLWLINVLLMVMAKLALFIASPGEDTAFF